MASQPQSGDHAGLMDRIYRWQRPIYDLTRKYYLFGRDRLIDELDARPGMAVLELGCGTGRNLELVARRWPGVRLHGLDISHEMLKSARGTLGDKAMLVQGDATAFDAQALFQLPGFERIVLSYAISMIPDWQGAVRHAAATLVPGGSLHIVDFAACEGVPGPLRRLLKGWLTKFHVTPRLDLPDYARSIASAHGLACEVQQGPFGYYQLVRLTR